MGRGRVAVDAGKLRIIRRNLVAIGAHRAIMRKCEQRVCKRRAKPAGRRVAGFARSLERPLVRIRVAIDAGIELDAGELHRLVGAGGEVALLAGHLGVHSRERILRLRMIELLCLFPIGDIVTAHAVCAELALVDVLMARHTFLGESLK